MAFLQANLFYKDYSWTARGSNDNPYFRAGNERALLNRHEGYEILAFINSSAKEWAWSETNPFFNQSCTKLEKLIRLHVPSSQRSRLHIKEWIETNWKFYWDNL